jgi:hypothetical protein
MASPTRGEGEYKLAQQKLTKPKTITVILNLFQDPI